MIPVMGVPVLTRYELLADMINTVDVPVDRFVVVDNGGRREPVAQLAGADNYWLRMPSNLGVAASWNLIIKSSPYAPWWLIVNFDVRWPESSLAELARRAGPDQLVLSGGAPPWCAFAVGATVVERVGLFDEMFHPAYFEDNDYERRVRSAGLPVVHTDVSVHHQNSSTLDAGYRRANDITFAANRAYYDKKLAAGDLSAGGWQLARRRQLGWDQPC